MKKYGLKERIMYHVDRTNAGIVLAVLFTIEMVLLLIFSTPEQRMSNVEKRELINNYQTRVQKLNDAENKNKQFRQNQKMSLMETESELLSLRKEKDKLKLIVETNKQAIEELFNFQEKRQKSKIWRERFIGFVSGILASLIAAIIWSLILSFKNKKNRTNT